MEKLLRISDIWEELIEVLTDECKRQFDIFSNPTNSEMAAAHGVMASSLGHIAVNLRKKHPLIIKHAVDVD